MFSSITSYLFGFGSDDAQADPASGVPDETLSTVETEGDWMLVEKNADKPPTPVNNGHRVPSNIEEHVAIIQRRMRNQRGNHRAANKSTIRAPSIAAASSIAALYSLTGSPASVGLFDGSWYITPPPCFTAGGPGAAMFSMASSPLENLLIEHPSMSVYENIDADGVGSAALLLGGSCGVPSISAGTKKSARRGGRRGGRDPYGQAAAARICLKSPVVMGEDNRLVVEELANGGGNNENDAAAANQRARRAEQSELAPPTVSGKSAQLLLLQSQLEGQKVKQRQQMKLLHRKQLERFNKVQEFESIGKHQRRKDFLRQPSCKSNNRKY